MPRPSRGPRPGWLPGYTNGPARHACGATSQHRPAGPRARSATPSRERDLPRTRPACAARLARPTRRPVASQVGGGPPLARPAPGWCRAGRQARLTAICWWLVFPGCAPGVTAPSRALGPGRQKRRARVPAPSPCCGPVRTWLRRKRIAERNLLPVLLTLGEHREAGGAHGFQGGGVAGHELELACCLVEEEVEAVGHGGAGLAGGGGQGGGPGVVDDVEDGPRAEGALGYTVGVAVGCVGGDGRYQEV